MKSRDIRQKQVRLRRQKLHEISPENSDPQTLSPLYSILPPEIRMLIFELVLCQYIDFSASPSLSWTWDYLGHEYPLKLDTTLLLTCRLVYYEAQAIPACSATHHYPEMTSNMDHYLYHLSSQQGHNLYHLHHVLRQWDGPTDIGKFIKSPHLQWKRITWRLRDARSTDDGNIWSIRAIDLDGLLASIQLPASCEEMNIEMETRHGLPSLYVLPASVAHCMALKIRRRDGSSLPFAPVSIEQPLRSRIYTRVNNLSIYGEFPVMEYELTTLTWRSNVPKRTWAAYDRVDCLQ